MANMLKRSIWFGRLVLGIGVVLFIRLGLDGIVGPVAVAVRTQPTFGSPDAITAVRVQGGVFISIAMILAYCLASEQRLLSGLGLLATIITAVAIVRLVGLWLDGPGRFTVMTVKAEVALAVLSAAALLLERQRRKSPASTNSRRIPSSPGPPRPESSDRLR
jgi:hypothetical protein